MRIDYDQETDILTILLRDVRIKESDEVRPGIIADFGYDGGVVRFEVLDSSKVLGPNDDVDHDFTDGVRGLHASRYKEGSNVVVLEPDVAKAFPNAEAVNRSLRTLAGLANS